MRSCSFVSTMRLMQDETAQSTSVRPFFAWHEEANTLTIEQTTRMLCDVSTCTGIASMQPLFLTYQPEDHALLRDIAGDSVVLCITRRVSSEA